MREILYDFIYLKALKIDESHQFYLKYTHLFLSSINFIINTFKYIMLE